MNERTEAILFLVFCGAATAVSIYAALRGDGPPLFWGLI